MSMRSLNISETPYRGTEVTVDKSQAEVRSLLKGYDIEDMQFTTRRGGLFTLIYARPQELGHLNVYRHEVQSLTDDSQGERQAMRMMYWWMKAKLETVKFGIADFETEFLPYQLISGEEGEVTLAEKVLPQLRAGGTDVEPFRPALPAPRD